MFTGKKARTYTRKENKTFLANIVIGFSHVDKFVVKIWPQFTQIVIQTEKLASTPGPPEFSLSNKSHFLRFDSSLHCHTDETEITYVSDVHLGITLITFYTVIQITLPGLQVSSCLLKPTKHGRGVE